eukprot:3746056-Alexandrium_andersonii.AAC.1
MGPGSRLLLIACRLVWIFSFRLEGPPRPSLAALRGPVERPVLIRVGDANRGITAPAHHLWD